MRISVLTAVDLRQPRKMRPYAFGTCIEAPPDRSCYPTARLFLMPHLARTAVTWLRPATTTLPGFGTWLADRSGGLCAIPTWFESFNSARMARRFSAREQPEPR